MAHDIIVDMESKLRASAYSFQLNIEQWQTISAIQFPDPIDWRAAVFDKKAAKTIPKVPGIYAFVIRPTNGSIPPHQFLMYVGISEDTLQTRFRAYLGEQKNLKRAKFYIILNKFRDYLYFYFAPVADNNYDLRKLEKLLNSALIPPLNDMDFTAEMRTAKKAFIR